MGEHNGAKEASSQARRYGRRGLLVLSTLSVAGCLRFDQTEGEATTESPEQNDGDQSGTEAPDDTEQTEEPEANDEEEPFDTEPGPPARPIDPPLSWPAPSGGPDHRGVLAHTVEPAADAALQWVREGEPTELAGPSTISTDEHVAMRVDSDLEVLDATTGDLHWQAGEMNAVPVQMTGEEVTAVVSTRDGSALVSYAVADGTERDRLEFEERLSNVTVTEEGIYYTQYDSNEELGEVIARDRADGDLRWRVPLEQARLAKPSVHGDTVYVGVERTDVEHGEENGIVVAIDRETGSERWRFSELQRVQAPVAVTEDAVFATSADGPALTAIESDSGVHRWTVDTLNGLGIPPIVDDEAVYFGTSDREFYRINRADGTPEWRLDLPGRMGNASMALVGRTLYVPRELAGEDRDRSALTAIQADAGELVWDVLFDNRFNQSVVPTGNSVLTVTTDLNNSDAPDRLVSFAAGPTE